MHSNEAHVMKDGKLIVNKRFLSLLNTLSFLLQNSGKFEDVWVLHSKRVQFRMQTLESKL